MSVVSLATRDGNPVTEETVRIYAKKISTGMELKRDQDVKDLTAILAAFHDSVQSVLEMEDYVPPALKPDLERFPRENITFPSKRSQVREVGVLSSLTLRFIAQGNPLNAWACKFVLREKGRTPQNGLLEGKTVVLKDNLEPRLRYTTSWAITGNKKRRTVSAGKAIWFYGKIAGSRLHVFIRVSVQLQALKIHAYV